LNVKKIAIAMVWGLAKLSKTYKVVTVMILGLNSKIAPVSPFSK
jgi:hypothetical protein